MKKTLIILIVLSVKINISFSQDLKFKWNVWPSFESGYEVIVEKNDSKCFLYITNGNEKESLKKEIPVKDIDSLMTFLESYEFPYRGSSIKDTIRTYYITKVLTKKNLVSANGLIINLEQLPFKKGLNYYEYDKKLKKCYVEEIICYTFNDGTTYDGEFTTPNSKRTSSVYCVRLSTIDYKLNLMILDLVEKYDTNCQFIGLRRCIESDKPKNGENSLQKRLLKNDKKRQEINGT